LPKRPPHALRASWDTGAWTNQTYPYLCLVHTYDPTGPRIGYSVCYCVDMADYEAWVDEFWTDIGVGQIPVAGGMSKTEHLLAHMCMIVVVYRQRDALSDH